LLVRKSTFSYSIEAYRYGSTLAVFDKTAADLAEFPREGKQLQLIAFVDRRKVSQKLLQRKLQETFNFLDSPAIPLEHSSLHFAPKGWEEL
jgi:hypothetical protein